MCMNVTNTHSSPKPHPTPSAHTRVSRKPSKRPSSGSCRARLAAINANPFCRRAAAVCVCSVFDVAVVCIIFDVARAPARTRSVHKIMR